MMNPSKRAQLSMYANGGSEIESETAIAHWSQRVRAFLTACGDLEDLVEFVNLGEFNDFDALALRIGYLEGLIAKSDDATIAGNELVSASVTAAMSDRSQSVNSRKVFVVHGHDKEARDYGPVY